MLEGDKSINANAHALWQSGTPVSRGTRTLGSPEAVADLEG